MPNSIILVKDANDFSSIDEKLFFENDVYSFSISAHKLLEEKKIPHKIAEEFLIENERLKIFDQVSSFHHWYKNSELKEVEFDEVNFFRFFDTIEFHTHLMNEFINFFTTRNIINKIKPKKIISTEKFSEILHTLNQKFDFEFEIKDIISSEKLLWEDIQIKQNIGKLPISFNLSRKNYHKVKSFWEKSIGSFYKLWFNFKDADKKTVIFLEFYPPLYEKLISNFIKIGYNVIFLNRRRPAISDKKSINLLKDLGVKIINYDEILKSNEKDSIKSIEKGLIEKLNHIFSNQKIFENIFVVEDFSLWNIIKNQLIKIYQTRIHEYLLTYYISKKILKQINIKFIMTLNEVGETEKIFLAANKNKIPSIVLEHGFAIFLPESTRFSTLSNYPSFTDKIAVWSLSQKDFLEKNLKTKSEKIIVSGSPRHDKLFTKTIKQKNKSHRILIAPTPITQIQGFDETKFHLKFEKIFTELCSILKNRNIEIILKLHPSQSFHNEIIKNLAKNLDPNITIHLMTSIVDLIQVSDSVITITPEGWGPSTIILESMILQKPIMNIILDNHFYDFPYVQQNAILIASEKSDLNDCVEKLVFNENYRNDLIKNGQKFIKSYLHEPGNASEIFVKNLISILEN
ncbi:CDP-glycerol glycerophosphotransferase family protein [Nitrosopumilus adriaticus]|uniref:Uncharacterized protein n=1 Tax=Nitrosopumilus adriaticus TaxID=1580092 RepID=A0A0D5C4S9_9ARCH|nr:CDP-glycerol glycerophosphotransferase family protein [Nitrosopumilus adriaticus]AJW71794.1 hypothetical protein NADRNF5_2121 [Nitrosopumilus adriaticus]